MSHFREPYIIVALDGCDESRALNLAEQLNPQYCRLKVGKELFTRCGPQLVQRLQDKGYSIFLDLKYHDIPNTVASACLAAAELGVWMLTLHVLGGMNMMLAAREAIDGYIGQRPLLIGVTILTSHNELEIKKIGLADTAAANVTRLALMAAECGLDGVTCSAREAAQLRTACGDACCLVTPGVRPANSVVSSQGSKPDDQQRVMTPQAALAAGSNYLVIGRPITQAIDPAQALTTILEQL